MPDGHFFELFLESFNAPHTDRRYANEFHVGALQSLRGEERERAEGMLLERLRSDPDDCRVAGALAIVGSAASAEPVRAALSGASGSTRVRLASALARVDPDFDAVPVLVDVLRGSDFGARGAAALRLSAGPRERVVRPLLDAVADANFGVRSCAFGALDAVGRRYIESAFLSELHNRDPRIPRALCAMGSERAALRELDDHGSGSP
jgi:HEAT repeat protein